MPQEYQFSSENLGKIKDFFEKRIGLLVNYKILEEIPASGIGNLMVISIEQSLDSMLTEVVIKDLVGDWKKISGDIEPYLPLKRNDISK